MPDTTARPTPVSLSPEQMSLVYDELRAIARRIVRGTHDERSLGATGLVHEAIARLLTSEGLAERASPSATLAITITVMGHVLADRSRERAALKRGANWRRVPIDDVLDTITPPGGTFENLYEAIERLGTRHERLRRLVFLRYFVGLSHEEIGRAEGVGPRGIEAALRTARAWLHRELSAG